jgi:hypothetical protein
MAHPKTFLDTMGNEGRVTHPIIVLELNSSNKENYESIDKIDSALLQHLEIFEFKRVAQEEYDIRHLLPFRIKLFLNILIWMSLVIGSFFKCVMYSYVLVANKQNRGWMHRPINVLTITSSIVHHITHIWIVTWLTVIYLDVAGVPLADAIGDYWCRIIESVCLYGVFSMIVSSLGIAIYRILYLTYEDLVKYVIGERLLLLIIWSSGIIISGVLVFLSELEDDGNRYQMNVCRGITVIQARIVLDYRISQGEYLFTSKKFQKLILGILMAFQIAEFSIYLRFFYIRYKNDNGNIKKVLTEDVIRSRNVKNITNFLGQFYGFLAQYAFLLGYLAINLFVGDRSGEMKGYAITIKLMDFGLQSAVEIFCSPSLRAFLKREVIKTGLDAMKKNKKKKKKKYLDHALRR